MKTKMNNVTYLALLLLPLGILTGCYSLESFPPTARAGDTVAFGAGWKKFNRESLTVTITDANSNVFTYLPNDPAVRAVINLYPDPLSYLVVGTRTGLNDRSGATYGSLINSNFTGNDPDWWQTSIYLDLPISLAVGQADVTFESTNGETYGPQPVQIIAGTGSPTLFKVHSLESGLDPTQLQSMEREPSYTVQFSGGSPLPVAIQVELTHSPDSSVGGTGKAFAVNPRGEMKNLTWTDNGTTMRVLLLTAKGNGTPGNWKYYKFYVTGGVTGVQVQNVKAYDSAGNPVSGVTAMVN